MDSSVIITLISVVGAIATTWLTVRYKDRLVKLRDKEKPMDRMETIFDGYEKLIKQQQVDIERKGSSIKQLGTIIDRLEQELNETRRMLDIARADLNQSTEQNKLLTKQLESMKLEYTSPKV